MGMLSGKVPAIVGCKEDDPNPKCSCPVDPLDSNSPRIAADNEAVYVQPADPLHSVPATAEQ